MKLLLVDDDPEMLLLVEAVLRRPGGFDTIRVEDPVQVCPRACSEQPDAILMDLLMEPIDGTEVLARLAADPQTRNIPVIFLTGRAEPEESERLCRLGAIGVIAKPIKPATLAREIAAMLECAALPRRPHA